MGLLSRFALWGANPMQRPGQTPPFVPEQPQEGSGQGPPFVMPVPPQPAPQQPQAQQQQPGMLGRIGNALMGQPSQANANIPTMRSNPLTFFLGGNNALRGMYDMRMGEEQRRLAQAQEQRATTQFGWMEQDRGVQQQQRQSMQAWVASLPADQQAAARANPEAAYEAYMEAQAMSRAPITPYQQAELDLQRRGQDIAARTSRLGSRPEGAGPGYMRPNGRDTLMMEDMGTATNSARLLVNSDIPRLRDLFSRMIEYDAQGQPLPASMQQTVNRYLQRHPEERAAFEQIESAIWPLVQQRLEGLAPITQFELGQAIARTPSANWTPQAVMEELDNMERAARLTMDLGTTAYDFQGEAGSLTTGRDAQGRSWMDVTAPLYEEHRYQPPGERGGAATAPPRAAPRVGSVQPTEGDVRTLLTNTSAERRRQFDSVYGAGAAERAIRQRSGGREQMLGPARRG